MGIFDVIKKIGQTVIPGGSKGYLEPKKAPTTQKTTTVPGTSQFAQTINNSTPSAFEKLTSTGRAAPDTRQSTAFPTSDATSVSPSVVGESSLGDKIKSGAANVLDAISAPLSQPGATFGGILEGDFGRGAQAVADSRAKIAGGDILEAVDVVGTTLTSTAIAGAGIIGLGALASSATVGAGSGAVSSSTVWGISTPTLGTGARVAINAKTVALTSTMLTKFFSKKALTYLGGAAGAVFLGQWGQAEAGEPISIQMRDLSKTAIVTGDWTLYDEAKIARDEVTNLATWEKIALWSPASPLVGIPNKIQGAIAGGVIMDKIAEDQKLKQATGQSEQDYWDNRAAEQAAQDKAAIDYYNDERKKLLQWEQEATENQRDKDARFWAKQAEEQRKLEEADREAIAEFWLEYRKELQKQQEDNTPSNLNFGGLF